MSYMPAFESSSEALIIRLLNTQGLHHERNRFPVFNSDRNVQACDGFITGPRNLTHRTLNDLQLKITGL
jgi:hypothetical protein